MEYLLFLMAVLGVLALCRLVLLLFGGRDTANRGRRHRAPDPWSEKLFAAKRTVDDDAYRARARESMRKLVEERLRTGATASPRSATDRTGNAATEPRRSARPVRRTSGAGGRVRTPWGW